MSLLGNWEPASVSAQLAGTQRLFYSGFHSVLSRAEPDTNRGPTLPFKLRACQWSVCNGGEADPETTQLAEPSAGEPLFPSTAS